MYICNFKLNIKKILIICLVIAIAITLSLELLDMNRADQIQKYDYELTAENFTQILKTVHNDIDGNIGKTIKLSGFVFTLPDFKEQNFVCGRDMMLGGEEKVVGFLCEYTGNTDIAESEWIEVTGKIIKGYYMGDMPVIKIDNLNKITAPANTFVDAPEEL